MLSAEKKAFIAFMADAGVLRFGKFVTKSGRDTPYFINTGNYKTGKQMAALGKFYAGLVKETLGDSFTAMFGPAYKGIPLAVACAAALAEHHQIDKPFFFNRKEEKDHGEGGSIIGYTPVPGDRIILIEDVITAGTAVREVMPLLKSFGDVQVTDMFISVDRMERGKRERTAVEEARLELGIEVLPIITVRDILTHVDDAEKEAIKKYMTKYC